MSDKKKFKDTGVGKFLLNKIPNVVGAIAGDTPVGSVIKAIIGGIIIATVSTIGGRYPTIGAFVLGIPLATFVSFIFMHYAGVDVQTFKIISMQTVYFVLVSLLFFPIFVYMISTHGFWISMLVSVLITGTLMMCLFKYIQ